MKILTFAWVRTQTSEPEFYYETKAPTVGALLDELIENRPRWHGLQSRKGQIRCALNQQFVERDAPLHGAHEIAFFPPVTGG